MFIIKANKHDRYVYALYDRIKGFYDSIDTHVDLLNSKRKIAEIDIVGRKGDIVDVYEVKCSFRISKAKKQLKRIKRLINAEKMNFFFYCGSSLKLQEVVV